MLVACVVFASASAAIAGTIVPKNIATLRSLDGRTLAVFSDSIFAAEASFGALPAVGMHAGIDGYAPRALAYAYAVRGDGRFLDKAASRIRGAVAILTDERNNAPLDTPQLDALIDAYAIVRKAIASSDRATIDAGLAQTARGLVATGGRALDPHRIDLVGRIGLLIDDATLSGEAMSAFVDFVDTQIGADGRTALARDRDALAVQVDQVEPLVDFALAAERNGRRLYTTANERGASVATAVAYLEPYASTGRLAQRESARGSTSDTVRLFGLASHFEPRYDALRISGLTVGETATALLARLDR